MNKVEVYVKNIKSDKVLPSGCHELICDISSWGTTIAQQKTYSQSYGIRVRKRQGYFMS